MASFAHRPRGRVELHCHILPALDDGPATIEESLELAQAAVADGISDVVATPHVRSIDVGALPEQVADFAERLRTEQIPVRLHRGGELAPDDVPGIPQSELELVCLGPPDARWVLLEAPLFGPADDLPDAADELRRRGFGVLLAHPERSPGLPAAGGDALLARELERGSRIQVNATSVLGDHGVEAAAAAEALIRRGWASAVSSDAHRLSRPHVLTPTFDALARAHGERVARALVDEGPRELLFSGIRAPRGPDAPA